MKAADSQTEEAQKTPNRVRANRITPRNTQTAENQM